MALGKRLIRKSSIISVFDGLFYLLFPLLLILYLRSITLCLITFIIFAFRRRYKEILIILFITFLILCRLLLNIYDHGIYYVKEIKTQSVIASNIIYDIKVYDQDLQIGDIIKVNNKDIAKEKDKIENIFYTTDDFSKISGGLGIRSLLWHKYLDLEDSHYKSFVGHVLFGFDDYDSPFYIDISTTVSVYYFFNFLRKIFKKTGYSFQISGLILFLLYGFDYGLIRVLIFEYCKIKFEDRHLSFALSVIILLLYAPYAIHSYRFIIPVILRFLLLFKGSFDFRTILIIIQSYFFNEVNIINVIFYRFLMTIIMTIEVFAILGLFLSPFTDIAMMIFSVFRKLISIEIAIRGKISLFYIFVIYLIIKTFRVKNNMIRWLIVLIFLLSKISHIAPSLTFVDVGQGDAILMRSAFNREVILIDTGNSYNYYKLDRFLRSQGIYRIDYLIITHSDSDHSANINDLKADYRIMEVITEPQDIKTESFYLKNLNDIRYDDENDDSLVYTLQIDDLSFLLTGDISKHVEEDIVSSHPTLDIDILKLSHHGSKTGTSEEMLLAFDVKMAIASTSGQYGHPAIETTKLLDKWQIPYLTTLDDGDINFIFYNGVSLLKTQSKFAIIK